MGGFHITCDTRVPTIFSHPRPFLPSKSAHWYISPCQRIGLPFSFLYPSLLLFMMTVEAENITADPIYPVPKRLLDKSSAPTPYVDSFEKYQELWKQSVEDPDTFFSNVSQEA